MKWLKRKLRNWVMDDSSELVLGRGISAKRDTELGITESSALLNFRVFDAVGGQVVEFTHYDTKTDRTNSTTYIITKDQNFGERISKIATMEMLK